ncbi:MAG: helix-turn-helix domain-containing protein [Bacteroidaceae bacterium]|nr:helix-turn-helix domain-containing protein [Bacteroidaceae bacterium]
MDEVRTQRTLLWAVVAFVAASVVASVDSFCTARGRVHSDMEQALALTLRQQGSDVITPDTIRTFNNHLQITDLRGKATLAVDTRGSGFRAYAQCSEATVLGLSDQRPAAVLWTVSIVLSLLLWRRSVAGRLPEPVSMDVKGQTLGGLTLCNASGDFHDATGCAVHFTPMQRQLMEMFFHSGTHTLTKAEICDTLWPRKPDASETLYTLVRRLKQTLDQHSSLKIEADRGRAYRLVE